ncbi:two-component system response regulator DesR [Actinopolyspora biskrensis]|uniref:Two-component system response regulator DesR n=1 Tax=Actinopolyspora biskrensis TaxID=1470178 RepID=A0A852Z0K8_9ACTN|nr:response regulator transcription factor [Actinopolyspora biskrensis]NYH78795.1 two-component system response regulator DesR [Actinopolyspora biskrensis]
MGGEITVVLAEDQTMVLGAFAELLDAQPDISVVASVTTGGEALEAVRLHGPHVLLADIEMPGWSGLDVAQRLHEQRSAVRVVIVTTFARSGYLRRAMDAGVFGYVLKDSPIGDLVDAIRRVRAGERVVAPELAVTAWEGGDPLTERERELLRAVTEGATNADIAEELCLAEGTVRNYVSTALAKLGARNRAEAANMARQRGWL